MSKRATRADTTPQRLRLVTGSNLYVVKALGGPLAIASIPRALADAIGATEPKNGHAA